MTSERCVDLARFFLPDDAPEGVVSELAEHIQNSIECWLGERDDDCGVCLASSPAEVEP